MNLATLFSTSIDSVIDSISNLIDTTFTSDDERLAAKNKLLKIKAEENQKMQVLANQYEAEITKRWVSDNENFITRLVRPAIVIFVYTLFGAIVLTDGNVGDFKINQSYIPMLETILVTITVAYFGSRGIEKVTKVINGS